MKRILQRSFLDQKREGLSCCSRVLGLAGAFLLLALWGTPASAQSSCTGFRTYTMGGWGADCRGNNPGCYLANNFSAAFGTVGVSIGCNNLLTLTTAQAVNDFLPSGSTAATLPTGALINPGSSYNNVLAGQLVAVTLAVGFDAFDPNFSTNTTWLGDLVITQGPFSGYTVNQFLQTANSIIGGCASNFSLTDLNVTATQINQNYDNGTVDHGFLACANEPLLISIQTKVDVKCFGESNGSVTTTVSGGVEPYSYTWYKENNNSSFLYSSYSLNNVTEIGNTPGISNLPAGVYYLLVTDPAGDSTTATIEITQPESLTVNLFATNVKCFGNSDGSVSVTATGGAAPYSYTWSNGGNTALMDGLPAGTYEVAVSCSNQCLAAGSVTINEPQPLQAVTTGTDVSCFGGVNGTANVSISGGTQPYVILWSNGETLADISGLAAGDYLVDVMDTNGCKTGAAITITQPKDITGSFNTSNVLCFGGSTGSASVSIEGGVAPYVYSWSNGSSEDLAAQLSVGDYSVTVSDQNGCTKVFSTSISQPPLLVAQGGSSSVTCYGLGNGSSWTDPLGGVEPYSLLWSNGSTEGSIQNLNPGTYSVIVTDANGCRAERSSVITQPDPLTVSLAFQSVSCYGGTTLVSTSVNGGTLPYFYYWNGSANAGGSTFSSPVGNINLKIIDANGCVASAGGLVSMSTCTGFVTVTQGGWGAKCSGGNWGCYLDAKFASVFPAGLTIGSCGRIVKLTSNAAVHGFLPNGGTPSVLALGTFTNPTNKTVKNTLAGQVVALTLNVAFDAANPAFAPPLTKLGDLVINSGTFAGLTVNQLLTEANKTLGGCGSYSADVINDACDRINRNYDNGTVNLGYLACPCLPANLQANNGGVSETVLQETTGLSATPVSDYIKMYPNPTNGSATLEFTLGEAASVKLQVFNCFGQLIMNLQDPWVDSNSLTSLQLDAAKLTNGMYMVVLSTNDKIIFNKLLMVQ